MYSLQTHTPMKIITCIKEGKWKKGYKDAIFHIFTYYAFNYTAPYSLYRKINVRYKVVQRSVIECIVIKYMKNRIFISPFLFPFFYASNFFYRCKSMKSIHLYILFFKFGIFFYIYLIRPSYKIIMTIKYY